MRNFWQGLRLRSQREVWITAGSIKSGQRDVLGAVFG